MLEESGKDNVPSILFFWDYDTQWGGDRSRAPGGPKNWGALEFPNTERLLELHAEYEIPACFAVVGASALPGERPYHDPQQIKKIAGAGHEVASHSFRHEWLPGLNHSELTRTLRDSKDALEQCIGAAVLSFVPPYNQPFDYPAAGSISISERREAGRDRTDLRRLCDALKETGYRFCRVCYLPFRLRLAEKLLKSRLDRPVSTEVIAGVVCVRLNTPGGFDANSLQVLDLCVKQGGTAVVYGHPHSLHAGNSQDEKWFLPFLQRVQHLRDSGTVRICLPRDLLEAI